MQKINIKRIVFCGKFARHFATVVNMYLTAVKNRRKNVCGSYTQLLQFCSRRTNLRWFTNRRKIFIAAVLTAAAFNFNCRKI